MDKVTAPLAVPPELGKLIPDILQAMLDPFIDKDTPEVRGNTLGLVKNTVPTVKTTWAEVSYHVVAFVFIEQAFISIFVGPCGCQRSLQCWPESSEISTSRPQRGDMGNGNPREVQLGMLSQCSLLVRGNLDPLVIIRAHEDSILIRPI